MAWEDRSEMIRMSTIGCVNAKYLKFEGFTITEFNAYAMDLFNSDYTLVDSIKINTPIGTCCDGIHVISCHGVRVTSCEVLSGDDGITIGIINGMDASAANSLFQKTAKIAPSYNIEIDNNYSYPEVSDVKAFGLFLWSRDYQAGLLEDIEIRDVYVRDCIFRTIGVWSENVWGGVTRIVPMSEFVWENNSYTGGYIGYPGIYDCNYFTCANSITNGDFDYAGRAFWSLVGNAGVAEEEGNRIGYIKDFDVGDAKLYEGFSIEGEQEYELKLDVCTSGDVCRLFVRDINTQETIAVKEVSNTEWQKIKFNFYVPKTANYQVGIERGDARRGWAKIDNVKMEGYIAPTTIFDEQISAEAVNGNAKELGTRFTTLDYGAITQVKIYAVAQERGTHTVRIWNAENGNLIAGPYQWSFEDGSEGWKTFSLPEPVAVGPNCEYIVSVSVGEDGYYAKNTQILSTSIETCDIVCGTDAGVYSNVAGQMPENVAGTECYLRDVVIETYEQSVLSGQKASPNVYDGPFSSIYEINKYAHLGAVIIADTDGFLTKIRCYASAQERGVHKVAVWNYETKTRIAGEYEWDFTATEGEGWYEYVLEKPIWIEKGSKYVVSVSGGDNLQVARGPLLSSDKTYGDITIVAGGGVYSDGVGVMPVHSWNSSNYMRDVCFVPSSVVSDGDELLKNNFGLNIDLLKSFKATTVSLENYDMVCCLVSRADTLLEKMSETAKDEIDSSMINYLNEVKTAIEVWDAMPYHPQSLMADLKPTELMYDGSENQVGVTIKANVDGYITAIRVYCEANESGKRKAYIWDVETKTAVASFETEITTTSEGWYQFDLPTAVAITANKLYVVSINCGATKFCPRGTSLTSDIVKENIQTVGGGVYATAPDTYPEGSWNWSNYLRDVCFVPASEIYDINEENAKAMTKHIDELLAMGTVNAENKERMQIRYDLIESVLATLDDAVKSRIDADKLTALEAKGQELDAYIYQSLMADLKPTELMYDGSENQVGVTIKANVDGYITAIRVYCEANESGKRKAYIWDVETKTAVASFETEITTTSEGWYQFDLPTAVAITANKLYVVSINCGATKFCPRGTSLTSDIVKENIQTVGGGVYATAPDTYPEGSWNWSNYLRDVCFATKTEYDALHAA